MIVEGEAKPKGMLNGISKCFLGRVLGEVRDMEGGRGVREVIGLRGENEEKEEGRETYGDIRR
jgi:hypothetical protein